MTAKRDLERRLADFYEADAPHRAPDWVLTGALATIDITPQRRSFIRAPWRLDFMQTPRLAAAILVIVAIAAAGVFVLTGGSILRPTPSPSVPPTVAPTVTPSFQVASLFRPRFTYLLPSDVRVDQGPETSSLFELRVPDSGGVGQSAWFLFVQHIEGGRMEPCSTTSGGVPLANAREALAYLKTVPTVSVTAETTSLVDGGPVLTATLAFEPPTEPCPQLLLWASDVEPVSELFRTPATTTRVMLLDVDGKTIAIQTTATREAIDWFRWADEIIASIHFQP